MSSRVFGVIRLRISSASKPKSRSSRIAGTDGVPVGREAGIGIEDFRAGAAEQQAGEIERHLAAGHDHHLVGIDARAIAQVQVVRDGLAQGEDADRRGVAVRPVARRLGRGVEYVCRRREVRLADPQVDHRCAGGLERQRLVEDGERAFLLDGRDMRVESEHDLSPG
jgi:hypothetical protein